ncbi:hypothetical protein HG536_0B06000 [Torulaspora globosa]|uniref:Uncharacterized protein n=1 Tax=Torulaspora globosa TaxID=48254 RepID=A0A7G3ZDZ8_9SACH|nr:uncharacterized protein HG536_0B06000 [Torulaspora globosa]QLL31734.1 hypothetical protein HG536_0B06000 [Torulaspora globosa]
MNVLITLGQILSKNGVASPSVKHEKYLLSMFEKARPVPNKIKINKVKQTQKTPERMRKVVTLKANRHLVGQGSNFQKKVVKDYLSPLRVHDFSRHEIKNDYDTQKATRMSHIARRRKQSANYREILFSDSRRFVGELLAALVACSSKTIEATSDHVVRHFPTWTMEEVPKIPKFSANPNLFEDYIGFLSHTKFLYRNSSSTNGIVPMILRNLMHPGNLKTLHLRTTRTYNDMIYYFCEKFDFASCREIFAQMKIEGAQRNTITYNLMLLSVLKNSHIRKVKPVDNEVIYYLKSMRKNKVQADAVTWTTCYNFLKEDVSRAIFIEQMQLRGVPITAAFVYTVLRNGTYSSEECLRFLSNNKVPLSFKLFKLCLDRLLEEDRANVAWLFLEHTMMKREMDFRIDSDILNSFLRYFAKKGRFDMAIITFNTCTRDFNIKPDDHTFEMLFKALVTNGYTKNFSLVLKYLKNVRGSFGLGNRNNYWLIKATGISKFNVPKLNAFSDEDLEKLTSQLDNLKWSSTSSGFTVKTWKENGPSFKRALRDIGCVPPMVRASKKPHTVNTTAMQKKSRYRRRIRNIAVQSAMCKRIPLAKDWYGTLKQQLKERNILADELIRYR